ncbi:MAG: nicotinate phosphoribosyltransferase [Pirellulales bacterium]
MTSDAAHSALLTDQYQLTMLQGYLEHGLDETAVFELFVRKLPKERNFLIAAGLAQFLSYVENLRFAPDDLEYLARCGFRPALVDYLASFRFTGDVHAMREGTIFFPDEPILRVTAPIAQGQLLETRAINLLHFQTVIASKAARMVLAAPGKQLVDFGLRRAHGAEAGLMAARASFLAGFAGTATVLAGQLWNVPTFGTMAHSFVEAHDDESAAFEHFALSNPENVTLILDTYDTEAAAHKTVALARKLAERGIRIRGVRLDSGDLAAHARRVRKILNDAALGEVRILASGGLDEFKLAELVAAGAPIDGFGVGTRLDASSDAPYLDCAYKLVAYAGKPRLKRSEGKSTWPGAKQVYRRYEGGRMARDEITLAGEASPDGEPIIECAMRGGRRVAPDETLAEIRGRAAGQLARLPPALGSLMPAPAYPVAIAPAVRELVKQWDREHPTGGAP